MLIWYEIRFMLVFDHKACPHRSLECQNSDILPFLLLFLSFSPSPPPPPSPSFPPSSYFVSFCTGHK